MNLSIPHLLYINTSKDSSLKDYYSGGMVMPDRNFSYENYGFGFNGKLKDDDVKGPGNSYNYGYRIYDPRIGRFLSVDPLDKNYPFYTPYQFAGNTPIMAIDIDGREPESVVSFNPITGYYKFTEPVIHLFTMTTGVEESLIRNVEIINKGATKGQILGPLKAPWYNPNEGGGAITLDRIIVTDNYMEENSSSYNGNGFGLNANNWLNIMSHEVKHLPQYEESTSKESYVAGFGVEYLIHLGHNNAPREKIADEGYFGYIAFKNYIDRKVGQDELINLLNNKSLTDQEKIKKLDIWNQVYVEEINKKVSSLLPKDGEMENETLEKNNNISNVSESTNPNK